MWVHIILASLMLYCFLWLVELDRNKNKSNRNNNGKEKAVANHLPGIHTFWDLLIFGIPYFGTPNYIISAAASKIFGPVFGIKYPTQYAVGILDLKIAKKIMSSPDWTNRLPDDHILYEGTFKKPLGLLFSNGEDGKQSRRFSVKLLHEFGFNRQSNVENFILFEMDRLHERIGNSLNKSGSGRAEMCVHLMFEISTLNIVWNLMSGLRFEHDDPDANLILKSVNNFNREFNLGATPVDFLPFLRKIPKLTNHDSWLKSHRIFQQFFEKIIQQKRTKGLYKDAPADFIDYYLQEIDKCDQEEGEQKYFTDESLIAVLKDMFLAGADTTNSTLEFAILHISLNPKIQNRVQEEIDTFIGQERQPSYEDKKNMIYTQAVLLEVMRYASSIPSVSRCPTEDNHIEGYFVPKGAITVVNLHGIHFSDQIWTEPTKFNPERFLNEEGTTIINADKILPFGYGKRLCIGESVARATLFLLFTSLLQKYTFDLSTHHPMPSLKDLCGLSRCPVPYFISITARKPSY